MAEPQMKLIDYCRVCKGTSEVDEVLCPTCLQGYELTEFGQAFVNLLIDQMKDVFDTMVKV